MVNHKALLSWAGPNHSASFVPLFAIGAGSQQFGGVIDNTDIPKIIKKVAGYNK
jgi:alkaline phosphatase